jgi:2,3-bisphosphoglycerate-independent phosphoglycerate mutase
LYDDLLPKIVTENHSKLLLLVMDGLGGLPRTETGKTELEEASIPEIDSVSRESALGLSDPIAPGITPGSGPAHLALFGYDPLRWEIGRGILSALGIGFAVEKRDLTARGNFATLDEDGTVVDRRAGRISTETNSELAALLDGMEIEGTKVFVKTEKEHRIAVIFRGEELSDRLSDSDPQVTGERPHRVEPLDPTASDTARIVNLFI